VTELLSVSSVSWERQSSLKTVIFLHCPYLSRSLLSFIVLLFLSFFQTKQLAASN
jgi:hypothetical protein